jgi:sugar lactone lactonase YvrE
MRTLHPLLVVAVLISCGDATDPLLAPDPSAESAEALASAELHSPPPGSVESVLDLTPVIDMPEGIAIGRDGTIFLGNRRLEGDERVSELLAIAPGGDVSTIAVLDMGAPPDFDFGVLGLAVNPRGDIYAAVASGNRATHGVWRVARDGSRARLPGSEAIQKPDALAFDARGNLYVSDIQGGSVWRFPPGGAGSVWLRHELLAPDPSLGANGLAFVPPRTLYVANSDRALIVGIPIQPGGSPGEPEVVAEGFELLLVDGLAADVRGDLHAVVAGFSIFGTAPLVRVDPQTGSITPSTADYGLFDFPTSLAFGTGRDDRQSVYVVNGALFPDDIPGAGPGVVRVGVGVPGLPSQ